jgi:AmmeMemoRadiSam system protein A
MEKLLPDLAKKAVETYVKEGKIIEVPKDLSEEFKSKEAGTFVTIEKGKKLRACIGTPIPTKNNIGKEVISNAISAATKDFRFGPIEKEELPKLSYTIYVLGKPEKISSPSELNPKIYGIIVKSTIDTAKSGLLLPDLEGINNAEEQIFFACQKAGIMLEKEPIEMYRFSAKKYK